MGSKHLAKPERGRKKQGDIRSQTGKVGIQGAEGCSTGACSRIRGSMNGTRNKRTGITRGAAQVGSDIACNGGGTTIGNRTIGGKQGITCGCAHGG